MSDTCIFFIIYYFTGSELLQFDHCGHLRWVPARWQGRLHRRQRRASVHPGTNLRPGRSGRPDLIWRGLRSEKRAGRIHEYPAVCALDQTACAGPHGHDVTSQNDDLKGILRQTLLNLRRMNGIEHERESERDNERNGKNIDDRVRWATILRQATSRYTNITII